MWSRHARWVRFGCIATALGTLAAGAPALAAEPQAAEAEPADAATWANPGARATFADPPRAGDLPEADGLTGDAADGSASAAGSAAVGSGDPCDVYGLGREVQLGPSSADARPAGDWSGLIRPDFGPGVHGPAVDWVQDFGFAEDVLPPQTSGGFGDHLDPGGGECTRVVVTNGQMCAATWTYGPDGNATSEHDHGCWPTDAEDGGFTAGDCEDGTPSEGDLEIVPLVPEDGAQGGAGVGGQEDGAAEAGGDGQAGGDGAGGDGAGGDPADGLDLSGGGDPGDMPDGAHETGVASESGGEGTGGGDGGNVDDGFDLSDTSDAGDVPEGAQEAGVNGPNGENDGDGSGDADDGDGNEEGDDGDDGDDDDADSDGFVGGGNGGPICWDKLREAIDSAFDRTAADALDNAATGGVNDTAFDWSFDAGGALAERAPAEQPRNGLRGAAAVVRSVAGSAQQLVIRGDKAVWSDLHAGDLLAAGTIIRTGFGAELELGFADKTASTVRGAAKMGLAHLRQGSTAGVALHVKYGSVSLSRPVHASARQSAVRAFRGVTVRRAAAHQPAGRVAAGSLSAAGALSKVGLDRSAAYKPAGRLSAGTDAGAARIIENDHVCQPAASAPCRAREGAAARYLSPQCSGLGR